LPGLRFLLMTPKADMSTDDAGDKQLLNIVSIDG
jgi:hypothetical protein